MDERGGVSGRGGGMKARRSPVHIVSEGCIAFRGRRVHFNACTSCAIYDWWRASAADELVNRRMKHALQHAARSAEDDSKPN